jgi:methionine sulfoxide reductase heme-binding subunit
MSKNRALLAAGILILCLYMVQAMLGIRWGWLTDLQEIEIYQQITGLALGGLIAWQWYLGFLRFTNRHHEAKRWSQPHKYSGVIAPIVVFLHSSKFGYAYVLLLNGIFIGNVVLGLLEPQSAALRNKWWQTNWLILHIAASLMTVMLMAFHLYVALAYQ